ncbi:non-ribosomal peptide synthetase [Aporhodopirellula aestuarii]|uniref:Amino acid adenylation domain-containing protein n=1 Tax=Aporhodopirellula aestuarii TaxID=2950107 RepID=A0ABT0U2N9_9BACT|nr:non-ribosomal peptide synthetase [Aporhodopirellula aestuarii]MCM2371158.1 amino acid adenylation domain-containing protein [Aporhodopirellula aestuarii]
MDYETGIQSSPQVSGIWTHGSPPPADSSTLIHFCRFHACGEFADSPAFTHVLGAPGDHDRLSFSQLDARARAIAAEIQARGGVGKPVLIVLDPGADYAAALFGCMYARAIAVPIYPPQMLRLQHTLPRLKAVIANTGAQLMLSDRATIGPSLSNLWQMPEQGAIAVDEITSESAVRWDGRLPKPDDIAVLQYTSGSTGNPRGVVLTHRILLSNLHAIIEHIHFEGARSVQWVPPYHDMGLIGGILLPIYRGVETVIISPTDFVRSPLLWLRCIDYYNGSSNGAPNFGYELCVRRIDHADCEGLDLSSWKVAVAGAEPVRASTLRRFEEKFARYGFESTTFCPAFGMAETTVMMTGSRLGEPYKTFQVDSQALRLGHVITLPKSTRPTSDATPNTQELVSSGTPVEGMQYEIVDPQTFQALPDGQIGEIWARGGSVAAGYWNDPEATEATFRAQLAPTASSNGCPSPDPKAYYLRTGDLAARVDGELIVTGRLKELIIVAGRNFYPHDIEQIVQSTSEAFKPDTGTAIGIDVDDSEEMVVIQELWRPKKFDPEKLLQDVVAAIAEKAQVTPHAVVLVRSGSLPKTSSGKLQRADAKEMLLRGELVEIARWPASASTTPQTTAFEPPQTATEKEIAALWSDVLRVSSVGRNDDFFYLGGSSLLIAQMLVELGERLSVSIPMTTLFRNPTLQAFAAVVDTERDNNGSPLTIDRATESLDAPHPLSSAQQRFWLLDQLGQTNAFVHVPVTIFLDQPIDAIRLETACNRVIKKHAMLRTRFVESDQDIHQITTRPTTIEIRSLDLIANKASAAGDEHPTAFNESLMRFVREPMDLNNAPLMRVALSSRAEGGSRIDIVLHHLVCDAGSLQTLIGDLSQAFDSEIEPSIDTDEEPIRYVDFARWDRGDEHRQRIQTRVAYWQQRLEGMPPELNLPYDDADSNDESSTREQRAWVEPVSLRVDQTVCKQISQIAVERGLTPSMVYLTAFQSVLARYGDSDDFGITIPTSNRPSSQLKDVVGCFINPIIYRARVDQKQSLADALQHTRNELIADLDHADVPFQDVVAAMDQSRDISRMPLSQVMFLYQPPFEQINKLGDANVTSVRPGYSAVTAYDITLVVHPGSETEMVMIVGDRVPPSLARRMMASMHEVLTQIADSSMSSRMIADLAIPSRAERQTLESAAQGKQIGASATQCLISRLRTHVKQTPARIAIQDDTTSFNYQEIDLLSDRVATSLIARQVESKTLVGVEMSRTANAIIAILGIWKAGAAYVPVDSKLPSHRRDQIKTGAGLTFVIDDAEFEELVQDTKTDPVELSQRRPEQSDLAYVIFTSGSTGTPKGVAIEHGNVSNLLASFAEQPGFTNQDSMLAVTTMSFDISVLEMFLPLWCGGEVCMTANRIGDDPESVVDRIQNAQPTVIQSTPSAFRMLLSANWRPDPRTRLLCGGEPLMPDLARDLTASGCELWNVYGPTETTVWSTITRVESPERITIGHPIAGTICRVIDRNGHLCPIGVPGELQIGGLGVARGYFRDEDQTQSRFITGQGNRFYKTGDQVRRLNDGNLEFLARNDRQVKLRGFRVELDEIESALQQCGGVDRAAVVLNRNDSTGGDRLIAFCSGSGDCETARTQLADRLPDYMIPATIQWLDELPQTPAGKTDYQSLPTESLVPRTTTSPPQTPLEAALAEAWCEVLECDSIGRDDNFFDLGGNSLMAAQLFARLRQRFDVKLPLREIYSRPTIAMLAGAIVLHQAETDADDLTDMLATIDSLSDDEVMRALDSNNYP